MRSVFYGVLLTVFVVCAGYVQAANDQDYISISDEPAFKPKSTVYSDKKKKTESSTGDDYISISDEPVITPKPSTEAIGVREAGIGKATERPLTFGEPQNYIQGVQGDTHAGYELGTGSGATNESGCPEEGICQIDQAYPIRPKNTQNVPGYLKEDKFTKGIVVTDEDN